MECGKHYPRTASKTDMYLMRRLRWARIPSYGAISTVLQARLRVKVMAGAKSAMHLTRVVGEPAQVSTSRADHGRLRQSGPTQGLMPLTTSMRAMIAVVAPIALCGQPLTPALCAMTIAPTVAHAARYAARMPSRHSRNVGRRTRSLTLLTARRFSMPQAGTVPPRQPALSAKVDRARSDRHSGIGR